MTEEYHRSMVFSIHRFIMRLRSFLFSHSVYITKPPVENPLDTLIGFRLMTVSYQISHRRYVAFLTKLI